MLAQGRCCILSDYASYAYQNQHSLNHVLSSSARRYSASAAAPNLPFLHSYGACSRNPSQSIARHCKGTQTLTIGGYSSLLQALATKHAHFKLERVNSCQSRNLITIQCIPQPAAKKVLNFNGPHCQKRYAFGGRNQEAVQPVCSSDSRKVVCIQHMREKSIRILVGTKRRWSTTFRHSPFAGKRPRATWNNTKMHPQAARITVPCEKQLLVLRFLNIKTNYSALGSFHFAINPKTVFEYASHTCRQTSCATKKLCADTQPRGGRRSRISTTAIALIKLRLHSAPLSSWLRIPSLNFVFKLKMALVASGRAAHVFSGAPLVGTFPKIVIETDCGFPDQILRRISCNPAGNG